jgi:uncharacterized membrane protein
MNMILLIHILAGGLGIVTGFVALIAAKGAQLHRRSGRLFVYSMVTMALSGALIAALRGEEVNVIAGSLAAYLVVTALATVRPPGSRARQLNIAALAVAVSVALASGALAFGAVARGGVWEGIPAPVLFMFSIVALLGSVGDVRMMRSGGVRGAPRLARHLWRMCFALYIATASFFLGQADEFPEALRIPALLAIPVLAPLLAMVYWLWRVRVRRPLRKIPTVGSTEAI